jgi:Arc/MetJ-type ribon-helix-helix transcriptional regulator
LGHAFDDVDHHDIGEFFRCEIYSKVRAYVPGAYDCHFFAHRNHEYIEPHLCATLNRMEVQLTPDQKAFVRRAIASGRLQREEDAVREALSLWEERERRRLEILVAVDRAEASLARGEGRSVTTEAEVRQLAADVKRRGMERLSAERNPRP